MMKNIRLYTIAVLFADLTPKRYRLCFISEAGMLTRPEGPRPRPGPSRPRPEPSRYSGLK